MAVDADQFVQVTVRAFEEGRQVKAAQPAPPLNELLDF